MSAESPADRTDPDVAMVLQSYEAYARGDIDAAVAPLHPDVEWIEPDESPHGGRRRGAAAAEDYLRRSRRLWTELVSETRPTAAASRWSSSTSDRTPDRQQYPEGTVADVYILRDGLAIRTRAYANPQQAPAR